MRTLRSRSSWSPQQLLPRFIRSSLSARLSFVFTAGIGLLALVMFFQFPQRVYRHTLNETAQKARNIAAITAYGVGPAVVFQDSAGIGEFINATRQGGDVEYVVVTDTHGRPLAAWHVRAALRADYQLRGEQPLSKEAGVYRVQQQIVDAQGEPIGNVYLGVSLARVRAEVAGARRWITLLTLLLLTAGTLTVYMISRWTTAPLTNVANTARATSRVSRVARRRRHNSTPRCVVPTGRERRRSSM